uniref:AtC3H23-like CCCH zinc finger domain-containing protein n=1 Tax=Solanum lycopersicum TaxID=4081 RepID=A0A3Q7HDE2_SOLLC
MYIYEVPKCSKHYCHDWTSCPFTHQGEKARRHNPRKYNYFPISLCHGVFEHWLHPAKYRTTLCQAETSCNRPICFFAHTLKELRPETKYNWCYVYLCPLYIQSYPIPCNPHLQPPPPDQCYDNTTFGLGNCSNPQRIPLKISSQSHSKFVYSERMKTLELGSTSHAKINKIHDDNGKRIVDFGSLTHKYRDDNGVDLMWVG